MVTIQTNLLQDLALVLQDHQTDWKMSASVMERKLNAIDLHRDEEEIAETTVNSTGAYLRFLVRHLS